MIQLTILILANIVFKGMFIGQSPNSLSLAEIGLLEKLGWYPVIGDYSFRYLSVFVSTLISTGSYLVIARKTKNKMLAFCIGSVLAISPWIVVISRFLNPFPQIQPTVDIEALLQLIDLRTLFFSADPVSLSMNIPRTGFFMYIDLAVFFTGLYFIYVRNRQVDLKKWINYIASAGILYFFLVRDQPLAYRGLVILYVISIVIGAGYYYLVKKLASQKLLLWAFLFLITVNLFYYQELLHNHFDKKNSFEWGYAEQSAIRYLVQNNKISRIYLTKDSYEKLNRYLVFFLKNKVAVTRIYADKLNQVCLPDGNSVCIIAETDLAYINVRKDDVKTKFTHFDGLPMYYLMPNEN